MSWVWQVLEESFALPIWNWGYKGHCMKKSLRCGLIFFRVSRTELLVKTAPTRYQEYPTWCRIFVLKDAPKFIHPKTIKIAISPVADSGLLRDWPLSITEKTTVSYQSCSWQWSSPWLLSFHCCCCLDQTPAWRRVSDCLPSVDASTISFSLFSWPRWFPVSNPLKCLPVSLLVSLRSLRLALAHFGQIPFVPLRITWD